MHPVFVKVLNNFDLCVAGDLFSLPDEDIVRDFNEVIGRISDIISRPAYLKNSVEQNVIEMCVTRITAAVRDTGSILSCCPAFISLLRRCLLFNLAVNSFGNDPPHAKIASDVVNCIFLNYGNRGVMEQTIPIGVEYLKVDNAELARNTACYFSLIAIQLPYLLVSHVQEIVKIIVSKGNTHLIRILPQLYAINAPPVLDNLQHLVRVIHKCSQTEKESLLHTCSLVAKSNPQMLWPLIGDLIGGMSDLNVAPSIVRIFNIVASNNPVPFLSHTARLKTALDLDYQLLTQAASIFGNLAKLGETVARDCMQYLISRYSVADFATSAIIRTEIDSIMDRYPTLAMEGKALMSKQLTSPNLNDPLARIPHSKPLPPDMRDSSSRSALSIHDGPKPPPYHSLEFGDSGARPALRQPSPFGNRVAPKSSIDARQVPAASARSRQAIFGSTSNTRLALSNDIPVTDGNRGMIGIDPNSKASVQSLLSNKGNSRRSLASSSIISAINQRGSKQSVGSRQINGRAVSGSFPELAAQAPHRPALSPVLAGRPEDYGVIGAGAEQEANPELSTFVVENPYLSKSSEAITVRSRRNSRHSLAPRPRSRLMEQGNQPQVIQVVPINDAVYQFCERNIEKIKKYMSSVFVKFPLPVKCVIEQHKSKKFCKLYFACQCKGDNCLYATRTFNFRTRIPQIWIHLMFLAIQARSNSALNQQDSAVHGLKLCWDHLAKSKDFSTLVTSAFPSSRDQEELLRELSINRYYDVFEYNAAIKQWGCFMCNYPEKATDLFAGGAPLMEGVLKEKKGKWRFFRRWRTRYFTLSGPYLSYKSSDERCAPIDMRKIRSVKPVDAKGIRSIPTVFEIFTNEEKVLLLKAKDPRVAEQWLQSLQVAMAQHQADHYGKIA